MARDSDPRTLGLAADGSVVFSDRERALVRVDQFVRVEIPENRRPLSEIYDVGHILCWDGSVVSLLRCDAPQSFAGDPMTTPAIGLTRVADVNNATLLAVISPDEAAAWSLVLSGVRPNPLEVGLTGLDASSFEATGGFPAKLTGCVEVAYTPQRLSGASSALVAAIRMTEGERCLVIRLHDGTLGLIGTSGWGAEMSVPAARALADVLAEFASVHRPEDLAGRC